LASVHLVNGLLYSPNEVMAQEKLNIAKTRDRLRAEVRVDFTKFGPINAVLRWSYDVGLDYQKNAMDFFKKFWARVPPEQRMISGGADIAILEDGSVKIIEFNVGNESDYMSPQEVPITANIFISRLLGEPTPLIQKLELLVMANERAQVQYLSTTRTQLKHYLDRDKTIDDVDLADVIQYLRDRMIQNWISDPNGLSADQLTDRIERLADSQLGRIHDLKSQRAIKDLARFARDYLESTHFVNHPSAIGF
jgi:hypothetical protein